MVIWTEPAKQDLKSIFNYIATDSNDYASEVSVEIISFVEKMGLFPNKGRVVPEIGNKDIRELFIYSYRIIYQIINANVVVLAIIHGKRKVSELNIFK